MHRRPLTSALLTAVALALLAAPASASQGPDSRDEGVHVPRLSCTGDTVLVTALVRGQRDVGPSTVTLQGTSGSAWSATGRSASSAVTKPGRNIWTLDVSGLRTDISALRAEVHAAGASVLTPSVSVASCAPGTEVPEVPAAALLPLTLTATAAGVVAVRSRRAGSLAA